MATEVKRIEKTESIGPDPDSFISYTIYDSDYLKKMYFDVSNPLRENFVIDDILGVINHLVPKEEFKSPDSIVCIDVIHTHKSERGEGLGTDAIKSLTNRFGDDSMIIATAAPLVMDYPEEPSRDEHLKILAEQTRFFEKVGFRHINGICDLEFGIPFIYLNNNPFTGIIHNKEIEIELDLD